MGLTNFPNGITSFGVPVLGGIGGIPFTGNYWFVDPANGLDGNPGNSPNNALKTLYQAHAKATDGNNDVVILIGDGTTAGTARLSTANAQTIDSSATAGTLNWTKNALHLVGVAAPSMFAQRARIAPPSGTYTQATFGSGNFVVVTGSGCFFSNFSLFNGFSTGGTNQICWTDNGSRNAYWNVAFGGMGDTASAQDAGSRSLKVGSAGSGENYFGHCTFGLDTVARGTGTVVNASVELAGGTPRNVFEDCLFVMDAATTYPVHILGSGASCIDRETFLIRPKFANSIGSGATGISEAISLTNAAPGGLFVIDSPFSVGATKLGDTNALANSYIVAPAPNSGGGLALNPA